MVQSRHYKTSKQRLSMLLDVLYHVLSAILVGVACAWIFLIKSMLQSFAHTPYLDKFDRKKHTNPKVSIIVPARNEENFIEACLISLTRQNYENYEIIAINDSSQDGTGNIITRLGKQNSKIIPVMATPKPEGWMGKNWACMEGFNKASGELLLFTDADTKHTSNVVSLAVSHLLSFDLDALSAIPKMRALDWWTKITLPILSTFLHTWFSALKVNDPTKKTGYFFGSFFIIRRETYLKIGTHKGVRQEIVEDGALGKKAKEGGHKIKMVRGEHLIEAVWARDRNTLWNALKRLMVPLYLQSGKVAVGIFFAVLFLLFMPFPLLAYSVLFSHSSLILFLISLLTSILIYVGGAIEVRKGLFLEPLCIVFTPIGSIIVVLGFLCGLLQAKSDKAVTWRGRSYSVKDHTQNSINI